MADPGFLLDLPIRERWQVVDVLRAAVFQCLAVVFEEEPFAEMASMVVGELVENALKYGAWNGSAAPAGGDARLRISGGERGVEIEVQNSLPQGTGAELLFTTLDRIRGAASPQDAYVERLREVARDSAAGGLGLARIAYEANCALTAQLEGQRVKVKAQLRLPEAGAEGAPRH